MLLPEIQPSPGPVREAHFWPKWRLDDRGVEPDAFMQFENIDIIIEAKRRDDSGQYPQQLAKEWAACHKGGHAGDNHPLVLLAVGGAADDRERIRLERGAQDHLTANFPDVPGPIRLVGLKWKELYRRLSDAEQRGLLNNVSPVLVQDLKEVLDYFATAARGSTWEISGKPCATSD